VKLRTQHASNLKNSQQTMSNARAYDYGGPSTPTGVNAQSFSNTLGQNAFSNSFSPSFKSSPFKGQASPLPKLSGTWTPQSYRA
jgi:hypothetical protein